jgi:hypothetical protein
MSDAGDDGPGEDGEGEEEVEQDREDEDGDDGGPRISQAEKIPAKYLKENMGARISSKAWKFVKQIVRGDGHPFQKAKSTHVCVHELGKDKWCNVELILSINLR